MPPTAVNNYIINVNPSSYYRMNTHCYIHELSTTHRSSGPQVLQHTWLIFCRQPTGPQVHRSTPPVTCMIDILSTTHNPQVIRSTGPHLLLHTWLIFCPQPTGPLFLRSTGPHLLLHAWLIFCPQPTIHKSTLLITYDLHNNPQVHLCTYSLKDGDLIIIIIIIIIILYL